MNSIALIPQDSIVFNHNQIRTSSIKVCEAFGKRHDNVLRIIQNIDCSPEFNALNFEAVEYLDKKGEKRTMWEMTKDGFMFLVMGFTGKKAAQIKEAFINAFNAMAAELSKKEGSKKNLTLSPAMQHYIQTCVNDKAKQDTKAYQTIYSGIKAAFKVGSYKDIPFSQFPALCKHLNVPVALELLEGEYLAHGEQQVAVAEPPEINAREHMVSWIKSNIQLEGELAVLADEKAVSLALEFHNLAREHIAKRVAFYCVKGSRGLDKEQAKKEIKSVTLDGALTLKFRNAVQNILFTSQAALELNIKHMKEMESAIGLY